MSSHHYSRKSLLLAACVSISAGSLGIASPAVADDAALSAEQPSVIFIGDSVTAGFGYLGQKESAPNVSGPVNSEYANSWKLGDNSLDDCNPPALVPDDRCSNNNYNGAPWSAGPWAPGPNAPTVSYSYQIAAQQDPTRAAPIENWAVTGSTPENWDAGGPFNFQLKNIKNTTVVMTLGANPILASFLKIRLSGYTVTNGACTDSTMWWGGIRGYWAYPPSKAVECARQQWALNKQEQHLTEIYKTLLRNGNKVMVLQYHLACPWSFGVWQPNGNVANGPAAGNSCKSQTEKIYEGGKTSQWEQGVAALNEINDKIASAVGQVQRWAVQQGWSPTSLQMATPDLKAWEEHQAWDADSWVFKNDTWIHPSAEGHKQLAKTVLAATCKSWGQWCGNKPAWVSTPQVKAATRIQQPVGSVPSTAKNRKVLNLPNRTKQNNALGWTTSTPKTCRVINGELVTDRKDGKCRITAYAVRSGPDKPFKKSYTITVS